MKNAWAKSSASYFLGTLTWSKMLCDSGLANMILSLLQPTGWGRVDGSPGCSVQPGGQAVCFRCAWVCTLKGDVSCLAS